MAVGLVALGGLGVLFVRSARNVQAEPYEVARGRLAKWTLAIEPGSSASGILLALRPQAELASALFSQVFTRSGESLSGPVPAAMPLVLQSEFEGLLDRGHKWRRIRSSEKYRGERECNPLVMVSCGHEGQQFFAGGATVGEEA